MSNHQSRSVVIGGQLIVGLGTAGEERISIKDIVAIGEHTNENGPHGEDYWLTIILRDDRSIEIGSEDVDSQALYENLGVALAGTPFVPGLCNQPSFASRLIWPIEHHDAPLLTFVPEDGKMRSTWSVVTKKLIADGGYAR